MNRLYSENLKVNIRILKCDEVIFKFSKTLQLCIRLPLVDYINTPVLTYK